jgi:hypothetical protein
VELESFVQTRYRVGYERRYPHQQDSQFPATCGWTPGRTPRPLPKVLEISVYHPPSMQSSYRVLPSLKYTRPNAITQCYEQTSVERNSFRFIQAQRNEFRSTESRPASSHASALSKTGSDSRLDSKSFGRNEINSHRPDHCAGYSRCFLPEILTALRTSRQSLFELARGFLRPAPSCAVSPVPHHDRGW